jgi:hypothetical protein
MIHATKKIPVVSLLLIALVACQSVQQRIQEIQEGLPLPASTVRLTSVTEEGQGSQDACFFSSLTELYSSDLSYDQVMDFYTAQLPDQEWIQKFPSWLPEDHLIFRRGDEYQLAVSDATSNGSVLERFTDINRDDLNSYATIYTVTLIYADSEARKNCPAWNLEQ